MYVCMYVGIYMYAAPTRVVGKGTVQRDTCMSYEEDDTCCCSNTRRKRDRATYSTPSA